MGFEPTTFCMASRRSSQLSYSRANGEYSPGVRALSGFRWRTRSTRILNVNLSPVGCWFTATVPRAPAKRPVPPVIAWS